MLKDASYKEKFKLLNDWLPHIFETVKRDVKNDHLKKNPTFLKKYFQLKNINKMTTEDIVKGYDLALQTDENAEEIAEFLANRWMLKNTEVYNFFEEKLRKIYPNFTEITEIDQQNASTLMHEGIQHFGAQRVYLFSVINSVVFPQNILQQLQQKATDERQHPSTHKDENCSLQLQLARITDKYEKKLLGLEKKYLQDIGNYKKQIAQLQRKLNEK